MRLVDEVVAGPGARIYAEGWQSWSPVGWYGRGDRQPRPADADEHLMRFRPDRPTADLPDDVVQGEGLLVVDPGTGAPARAYGRADGTVPTIRAAFVGDRLTVHADGDVERWEGADADDVLAAFALDAAAGGPAPRTPPTVWCSWYRYFEQVTAADVVENARAIAAAGLPVDVVQVDDGWSRGLGEYLAPRASFGSLPRVVEEVRSAGFRAGVWLAPFLVGARTTLAREHADWLTGPAGRNWGTGLVGLDLTHPGVRETLTTALTGLRELGIDYVKLDFLYGGALPGARYADVGAVEAYRSGLRLIRDALGPDAYLVGCGAPLLPSVGLVDAMRVSRDVYHEGDEHGTSGLPAARALPARAWQHGRLWVNDPDCLVTRPSYAAREQWARTVSRYGGLRSFSDRVADLDAWGLETTRALLQPSTHRRADGARP